MIVRAAGSADAAALSALAIRTYSVAFGHSFRPAELARHLEENFSEASFLRNFDAQDVVLVAEEAGLLVGFVQFGSVRIRVETATGRDQELQRLYVDPRFQRRGIGRRLMDAALAHPRLASAERIFLDVWEENLGARRLYESYGFEVIGRNAFVSGGRIAGYDLVMVRRPSLSGSRSAAALRDPEREGQSARESSLRPRPL